MLPNSQMKANNKKGVGTIFALSYYQALALPCCG